MRGSFNIKEDKPSYAYYKDDIATIDIVEEFGKILEERCDTLYVVDTIVYRKLMHYISSQYSTRIKITRGSEGTTFNIFSKFSGFDDLDESLRECINARLDVLEGLFIKVFPMDKFSRDSITENQLIEVFDGYAKNHIGGDYKYHGFPLLKRNLISHVLRCVTTLPKLITETIIDDHADNMEENK